MKTTEVDLSNVQVGDKLLIKISKMGSSSIYEAPVTKVTKTRFDVSLGSYSKTFTKEGDMYPRPEGRSSFYRIIPTTPENVDLAYKYKVVRKLKNLSVKLDGILDKINVENIANYPISNLNMIVDAVIDLEDAVDNLKGKDE